MGEQKVTLVSDHKQKKKFIQSLLNDVEALDYMLKNDWFESGITRIGAEQEMVLVDNDNYKAAGIAPKALKRLKKYGWAETELARFNLETNLTPRELVGSCFSDMDEENSKKLEIIQKKLNKLNSSYLLTGILPTLRKSDLGMHNLTPKKRYKALMDGIDRELIGKSYNLRIVGIDELILKHKSPMLEACNTSFQVHLQVAPKDFVKMYNIAQALAAPVMAIAANSPLVFGKRVWHESRIALFQQSLDTRSAHEHMRERSPRVSFGKDWLQNSILEIYKEDISRFRVLISSDVEENSLKMIEKGKTPNLRALQVHNSTVYRWNRPCYGISENGKPHLRIENRVLSAGPTTLDEMANTCFWLGCMVGMADSVDDIRNNMDFIDVRDNFGKAAKFGIDSKFTWFDNEKISACDLVLKLLDTAKKGLRKSQVNEDDIEKYLSIIESRAKKHINGARWTLRSYSNLLSQTDKDEALTAVTAAMLVNQNKKNFPVHLWELATLKDLKDYKPTKLTIAECMSTDLFTVQKEDLIMLVSEMMNWKNIRFMPVENTKGKLVGLISRKMILNYLISKKMKRKMPDIIVADIMVKNPITIKDDDTILAAVALMKKHDISCLPVVKHNELVGLITEKTILKISNRFFERLKE